MKKRILAFALTLAMVVTSLSMLSFVSFAEDAPVDDDANEEIATVLLAGYTAKEAVNVTSSATATATYSLASGNVVINVNAADLASVEANIGGYVTTATATEGAATITTALKNVMIYKDNSGNAVADLKLVVTTTTEETFEGTLLFVTNDITGGYSLYGSTSTSTGALSYVADGHFKYAQEQNAAVVADSTWCNLGSAYGGSRDASYVSIKFNITDMAAVNINDVKHDVTFTATTTSYDRICLHFTNSKLEPFGTAIFNIVNTNEGLVLTYNNSKANKIHVIPLGKTLGEDFTFEFVWDYPTYGCVKIDGTTVIEEDDIRSTSSNTVTNNPNSGPYFKALRGNASTREAFKFTMKEMGFKNVAHAYTPERVVAAGVNAEKIDSEGSIKLSYVQESKVVNSKGNALSSSAAGNGGTVSGDKTTMTVTNTATRAYAQGRFNVLKAYGNRTIEFTLNVAALNEYDFSNSGALTGDEKYTENIVAVCGTNIGITNDPNDASADPYDKLLIGAVAVDSLDGLLTGAMVFWVVNDTNDGLVLVHTDYEGNESVVYIGKKMNQNISFSISWSIDNSGSVSIDGGEAVSFDELRTVKADHHTVPNNQCYFAGVDSFEGYFGLNGISNSDTTDAAPSATLTLTNVEVEKPVDVRFIATINTLDAKVAGFDINLKGSEKVVTKTTDTAYNSIAANEDINKIYANEGEYFIAITVEGVPATGTVIFVVRPFYTYGAETIYGAAYEVTYTNGAFVSAVAAE